MREIIPGLLWLGNAFEARDVRSVLAAGIEIIVDLAIDELPIQFPREITYCRFPLLDGEGNTPGLLRVAINTISDFLQQKIPLLVACSGGMSRSPLLTAAALALVRNLTFESAINVVTKAGPHDFSPALWKDVKQFVAEQRESSNLPRLNLVVVRSWNALRAVEFYTRIGLMFVEEQHGKGPIHWAADHGLI
ncbi:MAG: dual specificity protein phosphatase family protein, partial [Planctomycetaceae bacterium]|nr:dual specificity protein phosphatase family protein [Planctomycetaceae bacterium]